MQYCMACVLATLVLDHNAMQLICDRGDAPLLFDSCISLLSHTLDKIRAYAHGGKSARDKRGKGQQAQKRDQPSEHANFDLTHAVNLSLACAQALWGSAYNCTLMRPMQIKEQHIMQLGDKQDNSQDNYFIANREEGMTNDQDVCLHFYTLLPTYKPIMEYSARPIVENKLCQFMTFRTAKGCYLLTGICRSTYLWTWDPRQISFL